MLSKEEIFKMVQTGKLTSEEAFAMINNLPKSEQLVCNVEAFLVEAMAETLRISSTKIEVDRDIREYGFDSVTLATYIDKINGKFHTDLLVLALLECPTIHELAQHMSKEFEAELTKYYFGEGNVAEVKEVDSKVEVEETKEEPAKEAESKSSTSKERINWNVHLLSQPIYLLHASKSLDEDRLMNFWYNLKQGKVKDIETSNITKEQLQIMMDAGYKYIHLLVKSPKGDNVEVVIAGVGKPVLLLAGAGTTATFGFQQIKDLSKDYQMISLHLPSCGLSDAIEDLSLEGVSEHIIGTLQLLPVKFPLNIIGASWGSVLAMKIAHMYAEMIETLVLVSGNTNRAAGRDLFKRVDMTDVHTALENELSAIEDGERYMEIYNHSECVEPISFSRYITYVNGPNSMELSVFELLTEIKAPTLVVVGTEDKITDTNESRIIYSRIEDAEYYEVKGAGHVLLLTHAEEFNRVVREYYEEHI